jgi:hypothetical protein
MPEKKTKADKRYSIRVDGKTFTWHPDADEGETLPDVVLPLRMKLKLIREFARPPDGRRRAMPSSSRPGARQHAETFGEMDSNDFTGHVPDVAGGVPEPVRGDAGGIVALADLIDAHRARSSTTGGRGSESRLRAVGRSMSWGEARSA